MSSSSRKVIERSYCTGAKDTKRQMFLIRVNAVRFISQCSVCKIYSGLKTVPVLAFVPSMVVACKNSCLLYYFFADHLILYTW